MENVRSCPLARDGEDTDTNKPNYVLTPGAGPVSQDNRGPVETGDLETGRKQRTESPVGESPKQILDIANNYACNPGAVPVFLPLHNQVFDQDRVFPQTTSYSVRFLQPGL